MTLIILYIKIKKDKTTEGQSLGSLVDPFLFSRAPALEVLRYHLSKTQLPPPLHPHKVLCHLYICRYHLQAVSWEGRRDPQMLLRILQRAVCNAE